MHLLVQRLQASLLRLREVIQCLSVEQYSCPLGVLSHSSIGMHTRHIIEFFECLVVQSQKEAIINYDLRQRQLSLQTDPAQAVARIAWLCEVLPTLQDTPLSLQNEEGWLIPSSMFRELYYNLEHLIHHEALLKIGLHVIAPECTLDESFGVAPSTLLYQQQTIL